MCMSLCEEECVSKSICVSDILCVSEDGSASRAWALLWYGEARLRGDPSGSRVHSDRGVRLQPGEGGGQLTLGLGAGERGRCWNEGYIVDWIMGRPWSPPPVWAQTTARLFLVCLISLGIETLRGEATVSSRDWES